LNIRGTFFGGRTNIHLNYGENLQKERKLNNVCNNLYPTVQYYTEIIIKPEYYGKNWFGTMKFEVYPIGKHFLVNLLQPFTNLFYNIYEISNQSEQLYSSFLFSQ
jgi:hypothetical protein